MSCKKNSEPTMFQQIKKDFIMSCPMPKQHYPKVIVAHGGGGALMHQLIEKFFLSVFSNPLLDKCHDAAVFPIDTIACGEPARRSDAAIGHGQVAANSASSGGKRLALTTDSYVVHPLFFPGGDIGALSVFGTVNDLAMAGARPMYLTASFIIEEGLAMETLWQVAQSMKRAADEAGVQIVTGDTKVVDKGKGDGIFINTAGVGVCESPDEIGPARVQPGDAVIISGDIGRHGMAIMAVREGLHIESKIDSDLMPLAKPVLALLAAGLDIHCLRDTTRGGLATTLNEIARTSGKLITIKEKDVPVRSDVHAACEIMGFDPLYVACEGRFVVFLPSKQADRALKILRDNQPGIEPRLIGTVKENSEGLVVLESQIGVERVLDMLSGEQLPRIC